MNPINLVLRFLLEVVALIAGAIYGASLADGLLGILASCSILVALTVLWVTFNVPNDPSRSGKAPIKVPGIVRLILELLIFGFAAFCLYHLSYVTEAIIFSVIVILHYIASCKRLSWLVKQY